MNNWTSSWTIEWSKKNDLFGNSNQVIFFFLPWILLAIIFFARRYLRQIPNNYAKWIYSGLGAFAIFWEGTFDILSLVDGAPAKEQFMGMLDLCRLNMYLVGIFLLFRKINWVKWVVATSLWGGVSTLFDHYQNTAQMHSLITHAIILASFPSLAITISGTNYSFKNYIFAHLFNWSIVIILISTNYAWGRHAGELHEVHLADNALVGFMPYGGRIILWILVVMVIEFCYFTTYRFVFWWTYERQAKTTGIVKSLIALSKKQEVQKAPVNPKATKFWKSFAEDARKGLKEISVSFLNAPSNIKNAFENTYKNIKKATKSLHKKLFGK